MFVIFLALSFYNIGFTAFKYFTVRQELSAATGEQMSVRNASAQLAAAIKEMQALKTRIVAYLEFTREELPAVEFMTVLEDAIPAGLKISNVEVRSGNAMMEGTALTGDEIIAFAANLDAMKYIVTKVDSPVTTKSDLGTRQVSNFKITCDIRKILDIAANEPTRQLPPGMPVPTGGGGQ
jgi:hypothetical protein